MTLPKPLEDDAQQVLTRWYVSRETRDRLVAYADLTRQWQKSMNLVAPSTLPTLWTRHIEDGLWLHSIGKNRRAWVDLGSGGGFPGLVVACCLADEEGRSMALVEANGKKCAFLRHVVRELALPATVHHTRIEQASAVIAGADAVSARALASLDALCGYVAPALPAGAHCYFLKGRTHPVEIEDATANWRFDMVKHTSRTDAESVILELSNIAAQAA